MTEHVHTVVVGGGAMGSAAAWQLATRGVETVLLERFEPGHRHGASHGASRNFNVAYATDTQVGMIVESERLWRELEAETGQSLLTMTGLVNHGADPGFARISDALGARGIPAEFLPPEEAARRWPGLRFETPVLHTPSAGRLDADRSVAALQRAAADHGADVRHGTRVTSIDVVDDHRVRVATETGDLLAHRVVVAAGAWTAKLIGHVLDLPRLTVTQEQPAHFALLDDAFDWPGFNHWPGPDDAWWHANVYGMHTPGEGIKAGWHRAGPEVDPDARDYRPEPAQLAALQRYVREWIPGADAEASLAISCTYTTTVDAAFVIDSVGPVTVAAGFAGEGFKFTTAVGRMLADLTAGRPAPEMFSLRRFG
jgi:sarcosine oxidase